jgi:hypothetical protein
MSNKTQEGSFTSTLPGGNPLYFKVETTYQTDTNGNPVKESAIHTLKYNPGNGVYYPAATTKDFKTFELKKYTPAEIANAGIAQFVQSDGSVLGPTAAKSLQTYDGKINKDTRNAVTNTSIKNGLSIGQSQVVQGSPQTLPNSPDTGIGNTNTAISKDNYDTLKGEVNKDYVDGTRKGYYGDVKYPEKLSLQNQDCIKFTIIEYNPRTLSVKLNQKRRTSIDGKKRLGTITLPIPAGIGDRNNVNWGEDRMNILGSTAADLSMNFILGGVGAATNSAQSSMQSVLGTDNKAIEAFAASKATELAVGSQNLISRQFGASVNDNLELLFNGPSLRSFTLNFRFTPRESKESENIKKIIRFFKQAMAPKRTKSVLLLKAPHTFTISYLSKNEDHRYLNKFKECALTDCAVSYTPDGTYMTYTDSSMTAYELSLTFQELEAVFDDDYGLLDNNTDKFIGY